MDKNNNKHTFILTETENIPWCSCCPSWKSWEVSETGNKDDGENINFKIEKRKREFSLTKGKWKNNFYVDDGLSVDEYETTEGGSFERAVATGAEVFFYLQLQQNKNLTSKSFYEQRDSFYEKNKFVKMNKRSSLALCDQSCAKDDDKISLQLHAIYNIGEEGKEIKSLEDAVGMRQLQVTIMKQ